MQAQHILADPVRAIEQRWGETASCPCTEQVDALVAEIKQAKPTIKKLKKLKGEYTREFANSSLNKQQSGQLKQQVGEVSAQIKKLEASMKSALADLAALFESDDTFATRTAELPACYLPEANPGGSANAETVELATDAMASDWDRYVSAHPRATIYHRYAWKHALESAHKIAGFYLVALNKNDLIVGILPVFNLRSHLFGNFLVSVPYVNYGGPLANSHKIEHQLLERAAVIAANQGAQHFETRCTRKINDWPQKCNKVSMLLPLPASPALLDQQLSSKLRSQVKQAQRHSMRIQIGQAELLDDFYLVFARNMRDLGTPVYGKAFFRTILKTFPESATIIVVYNGNKAVASGFLLGYRKTLEIPWASTLREYNRLNANMFMYRSILDYAIKQGYQWFDFGRSTIDAPTYQFKKQWGAMPVQHHWHYWLPEGELLPEMNPDNTKYSLAIQIWKKLPVRLSNFIGPKIVKNIP